MTDWNEAQQAQASEDAFGGLPVTLKPHWWQQAIEALRMHVDGMADAELPEQEITFMRRLTEEINAQLPEEWRVPEDPARPIAETVREVVDQATGLIRGEVFEGAPSGIEEDVDGPSRPSPSDPPAQPPAVAELVAAVANLISVVEQLVPEPSARGVAEVVLFQARHALSKFDTEAATRREGGR